MHENQDIEVLREMVRLAEAKRAEALETIERLNKYNLAVIAFAGSFLSLLISVNVSLLNMRLAGAGLVVSICFSLFAIRPKRLQGASLTIEDDIDLLRKGIKISLSNYLLDTSDLTSNAARVLQNHAESKKRITILSAVFLAFSLVITYILYAYA